MEYSFKGFKFMYQRNTGEISLYKNVIVIDKIPYGYKSIDYDEFVSFCEDYFETKRFRDKLKEFNELIGEKIG